MLSRSIMATRDVIRNTAEAQRLALFFDHILIWPIDRRGLQFNPVDKNEFESLSAELEYLSEKGVVVRCGSNHHLECNIIPGVNFTSEDVWNPFSMTSPKNCDLLIPDQANYGLPEPNERDDHTDNIIRHFSAQLKYKDAPVTAHIKAQHLIKSKSPPSTLEVCIKKVPMPPENMPWEDFLQFRSDEENIQKLTALRLWMQKQASSSDSALLIQEELESLLHDYLKYMELQHKKHGEGIISTVIAATPEALAHLLDFKIGSALKAIFDLRAHSIALNEAEMTAPGREVSYIIKASEFTNK